MASDALNDEIMYFVRLLKSVSHNSVVPDRSALLLLWPLMHVGPMRVRDLAAAKGSDASTVSRQVAELVEAGLVSREPDPADRRAWLLALTDGGRGVCERLVEGRRRVVEAALHDWAPAKVRLFTDLFHEFNQAMEAQQLLTPASAPTTARGEPAGQPAPPTTEETP